MISSSLRWSALLVCALLAVFVAAGSAAAADTTSPTATVSFTPSSAPPGASVTITATVTPGTNPDSTGLGVTCDLSWAGLGNSAPLDPDASGLVFSRTFTVPGNAVPGERVGTCSITDAELRSSSPQYSFTISSPNADTAPTVASHTPADGETGVAVDANIGITFSEPVDVTGAWYSIECGSGPAISAVVTGGPTSYLLDPVTDLPAGTVCTVTLTAAQITDQDTNDPPDQLVGTAGWTFTTATPTPVTFDSLCALVRSYSTDPKVADDLCAKLAAAEAAPTATAQDGVLGAFRNQVDAKTGKSLTKQQADELKRLSLQL